MAPEWWFQMMESAEANHDPSEHGGREWDGLSDEAQDSVIRESIRDAADIAHQTSKETQRKP